MKQWGGRREARAARRQWACAGCWRRWTARRGWWCSAAGGGACVGSGVRGGRRAGGGAPGEDGDHWGGDDEGVRAKGRAERATASKRGEHGASTGLGEAEDTSRWWWDGRLQAVLRACRREARALARIAIAAEARLPGKQTTAAVSIRATVLRGAKRGAADTPSDGRGSAMARRTGTRDAEEEHEDGARTRREKRRQQNNQRGQFSDAPKRKVT